MPELSLVSEEQNRKGISGAEMTDNVIKHPAVIPFSVILAACTTILMLQSLVLIDNQSFASLKTNLLLQLILVTLFAVWSYMASGKYINAPVIFILAIYFWHSPFITGHYFELGKTFEFSGRIFTYGEEFIPRATGLVGLCITAAIIGTLIGYYQQTLNNRGDAGIAAIDDHSSIHVTAKQLLWTAFIGYGILTLLFLLVIGVNTFSTDYMSLYTEGDDSFLYRLYQSTKYYFSVILLAVFAFIDRKREYWLALAISLSIILIQFLLGTRSVPFINLIALLLCVDYFIKRLPFILLPASFLFMSAISYIVAFSRVEGLGFNVFNFAATGRELDLLHFFYELGGVIRNVIRTMAFMGPEGFVHGKTFFFAFVYLLPKFYLDGLGFQPDYMRPSDWLVANSADVPYGGGIGYSMVAESYLNFGMAGCLLFLLVGWFIAKKYFDFILSGNRYSLLHAMNIVITLSLHMRNDSLAYTRIIVYGFLFIELLRWLDRRNRADN